MSKFRNYVFTSYNVCEPYRQLLLDLDVEFIVFQTEKCPDTNRLHYQGYVELKDQMRLPGIKKLMQDNTVHIEQRKGSGQQAADYCRKAESRVDGPWEKGTMKCPGKRSDLDEVKRAVDEGKRGLELWEENFGVMCRYEKSIQRYISLKGVPRTWKTEVFLFYGDAGTGKSRKAFDTAVNPYIHDGSQWFDGYADHDDVIIDDYMGGTPLSMFLKMLDRYPMQVPIKGGYVNWKPKRIFITANTDWMLWYPKATAEQWKAIERRLDHIEFFDRNNIY